VSDRVVLELVGDGHYLARWHTHRYRFMFDGTTVDVESPLDGSDLRGELLDVMRRQRKKELSIMGVADVKPEPAKPAAAARKRRTTK
jgi:hypothetical protein